MTYKSLISGVISPAKSFKSHLTTYKSPQGTYKSLVFFLVFPAGGGSFPLGLKVSRWGWKFPFGREVSRWVGFKLGSLLAVLCWLILALLVTILDLDSPFRCQFVAKVFMLRSARKACKKCQVAHTNTKKTIEVSWRLFVLWLRDISLRSSLRHNINRHDASPFDARRFFVYQGDHLALILAPS